MNIGLITDLASDVKRIILSYVDTVLFIESLKSIESEDSYDCSQGVSDEKRLIILASILGDISMITEFNHITQRPYPPASVRNKKRKRVITKNSNGTKDREGDVPEESRDPKFECIINAFLAQGQFFNALETLNSYTEPFHYNAWMCAEIGKSGNIKIFKWALHARRPNFLKTSHVCSRGLNLMEKHYVCAYAASMGNKKLLEEYHANNHHKSGITYKFAANYDDIDLLEWLYENSWPIICEDQCDLGEIAVIKGRKDLFEWALGKQACKLKTLYCCRAAENGNIDILKWLRAQGCPWSESTLGAAAMNGHTDIVHWAFFHDAPYNNLTCACAARGGHLHILLWLRDQFCPCDALTYIAARCYNRVGILDCLSEGWKRWIMHPTDIQKTFHAINHNVTCDDTITNDDYDCVSTIRPEKEYLTLIIPTNRTYYFNGDLLESLVAIR